MNTFDILSLVQLVLIVVAVGVMYLQRRRIETLEKALDSSIRFVDDTNGELPIEPPQ